MDTLTGLLDGARAREAFLLRTVLEPPFALRIQDEAPLSLVAMLKGSAQVIRDSRITLNPGDVAVICGPQPYTVADDPATPWQTIIHPGQVCTTVDGTPREHLGVRSWGDPSGGGTELITGTYQLRSEVSRRLLRTLPSMLVQPAAGTDRTLVGLLSAEMGRTAPGQELVLDRLLDLLLISVLRSWLAGTPTWHDPIAGTALRLLHAEPAAPWTVAELARRAGVSRSLLARRFTELVGEPPMAYLTGWRLALAADLLRDPSLTLGAVARQVGYGSAFALSAAFKRERGLSPQDFRQHSPDMHFTAYDPGPSPVVVLA
ncbi:AraC family transcriptional regulator [Actinoplanes regularis]|uniref:AraC family transcriptional regulator n=1 Tax=Actinoplanes regularis TaxID=52697 RepID=UPI00255223F0|nr:AraC family transcriptional regulator [Actinoplanes regularis]GLW27819.1 AraC family transcriptional regulator [Actinoplanes regularis]